MTLVVAGPSGHEERGDSPRVAVTTALATGAPSADSSVPDTIGRGARLKTWIVGVVVPFQRTGKLNTHPVAQGEPGGGTTMKSYMTAVCESPGMRVSWAFPPVSVDPSRRYLAVARASPLGNVVAMARTLAPGTGGWPGASAWTVTRKAWATR